MARFQVVPYRSGGRFQGFLGQAAQCANRNALKQSNAQFDAPRTQGFFQWLAMQPGYKSRVNFTDAEYFNLSEKEARIANAKRIKTVPTPEQVKRAIEVMPIDTVLQRRDRALLAFTLLTGARDGAIASFKLKHVDLEASCVHQDAREVNTKASKTFTT